MLNKALTLLWLIIHVTDWTKEDLCFYILRTSKTQIRIGRQFIDLLFLDHASSAHKNCVWKSNSENEYLHLIHECHIWIKILAVREAQIK